MAKKITEPKSLTEAHTRVALARRERSQKLDLTSLYRLSQHG